MRHKRKCCRLDQISTGKPARIRCHHACGAVRQRLLDLGFVPDSEICVIRRAPLGDPIQCKIANYNITLRRTEACMIEVEEEPETAAADAGKESEQA